MTDITTIINNHFAGIKEYKVGDFDGRGMSWEWCHGNFINAKKDRDNGKDIDYDYLALHLFAFLGSWGMFRNSKLMSCDYKILIGLVQLLFNSKYDVLWDYDPTKKYSFDVGEFVLGEDGPYDDIKKYLISKNISPTDTLVTKIMLVTYACFPAIDNEFRIGLNGYIKRDTKEISKGYEKATGKFTRPVSEVFNELADFYVKHKDEFDQSDPVKNRLAGACQHIYYPPMKLIDMYFNGLGHQKN